MVVRADRTPRGRPARRRRRCSTAASISSCSSTPCRSARAARASAPITVRRTASMTRRLLAATLALAPLALTAALARRARAGARRVAIAPYIEVSQVADADLKNGDVLTYTSVAAASTRRSATPRAAAQVSYRYEHRFAWDDDIGDDDIHHRPRARDGRALRRGLSSRRARSRRGARTDIRGAAPGLLAGNVEQYQPGLLGLCRPDPGDAGRPAQRRRRAIASAIPRSRRRTAARRRARHAAARLLRQFASAIWQRPAPASRRARCCRSA